MGGRRRIVLFLFAAGAYAACAVPQWHAQAPVWRGAGIVAATLILWIGEVAPLGVTALGVPVASVFAGILTWREAVGAWGDEIVFLFLGAFLLARALDKHGAFDFVRHSRFLSRTDGSTGLATAAAVLLVSGAVSTMQNNTAVAAMLLPATTALAKRTRGPAAVLLALAWGSTFGGMATPVGTAPNFIGYEAMRRMDAGVNFLGWMRVGLPVWLGTSLIGWGVLAAMARWTRRSAGGGGSHGPAWMEAMVVTDVGPVPAEVAGGVAEEAGDSGDRRAARRIALVAFGAAAAVWLATGVVKSAAAPGGPAMTWVGRYLPESLVPIVAAWLLFLIPAGRGGKAVLDRHDFQALDWDTLFLIAGGLGLGRMLEASGFGAAVAAQVQGAGVTGGWVLLALAATTVVLSELTSNTATAALMVPIAAALAKATGVDPVQAVWTTCLSASLGFALPVSTPPNALVYGTGLVPLRWMVLTGVVVDGLAMAWVVACVRWLG